MVDSTLWTEEEEKARAGHRFAQRLNALLRSPSFQAEAKQNKAEFDRAVKEWKRPKSKK